MMRKSIVALIAATYPLLPAPLVAQISTPRNGAGDVHDVSRVLVTSVQGREDGAGILVGLARDTLFVVTAAHVLFDLESGDPAPSVTVAFAHDATPRPAHIVAWDLDVDLAVIAMPTPLKDLDRIPDRLGDVGALTQAVSVRPVGCPNTMCWLTPVSDDRVQGLRFDLIEFQSPSIAPGSSGGALFNQNWEVVGMLLSSEPPYGTALKIDEVARRLEDWNVPFQLTRSSVPRAGYRTSVGGSLLFAGAEVGERGARLSMIRRGVGRLDWHIAGLRLAPANLTVMGILGGVGYELSFWDRLQIRPFAEVGFASVASQYDIGGYLDGRGTYVPIYRPLEAGSVGWGYGSTTSLVFWRGLTLEVQVGRWSFATPLIPQGATSVEAAPELTQFFWGVGLRYGMRN